MVDDPGVGELVQAGQRRLGVKENPSVGLGAEDGVRVLAPLHPANLFQNPVLVVRINVAYRMFQS